MSTLQMIVCNTSEDCAQAAVSIYKKKKWRWVRYGEKGTSYYIPKKKDIIKTLKELEEEIKDGCTESATGRLHVFKAGNDCKYCLELKSL
jgi:hypothetical protein